MIKKFRFIKREGRLRWVVPNKDRPDLVGGDIVDIAIIALAEKINEIIDILSELKKK